MRALLALIFTALVLTGCASAVEEPTPAATKDASTTDAATPDAGAGADAGADPYPYACCPFADEGLTEFDACCAEWRAAHDGG